jgi:predicted acyl esterase
MIRRTLNILICAAVLVAGAAHAATEFGAQLPPAVNEIERASFYIPMSDGTRLAADVYRPKAPAASRSR